MDYTLALLFSVLQFLSVGRAAAMSVDVILMKSKVKWMAEQLVVKLDKKLMIPAGLTLRPPAEGLDGLSSIVPVLNGYNSLITDSLNGISQVKMDISSLTACLDQWRRGHCSEQRPKHSLLSRLKQLQSYKGFLHTMSIEALLRVREFLNLLLKNLDSLETC